MRQLILARKGKIGKAPLCNLKPERGFTINGFYFPLCIRCTGVCCGALVGSLIAPLGVLAKLAMLTPIALDTMAMKVGPWKSNSWLRAITGLLCGMAIS